RGLLARHGWARGPDNLPAMEGRFAGWKGDFQGYFLGLRADNSKAYFEAHRRQYDEEVKGPMVALLADLESEFGPARLSRPNRDIRFSADKSPYKTNIYADASGGGYVALDATGLVAAGGAVKMGRPPPGPLSGGAGAGGAGGAGGRAAR